MKNNIYFFPPETPKIIQWTIKYSGGLIKNKKQAIYMLIGIIALIIILSIILLNNEGIIPQNPPCDLIHTPQPEEGYIPR